MMGAKINGKIVPIDYTLQNGDIIEILTSSSVHGPSRDWLKVVKTAQARNKINQWFKKERRDENIIRGKDLVDKELKRHSLSFSQIFRNEWLEPILKRYSLNSIDDLYASIGYGGLTAQKVVIRLRDEYSKVAKTEHEQPETPFMAIPPQLSDDSTQKMASGSNGIIVHGIENCLVRLARCCTPVPGDDIIGFVTRGRGVSVHRRDCPNMQADILSDEDINRLINVSWENSKITAAYRSELMIEADDRNGILAEITASISELKIPIKSFNARTVKGNVAIITITIEITGAAQLENVIRKIYNLKDVYNVTRCTQ